MEVFAAATIVALAQKFTSLVKFLSAGQIRSAVTLLLAWFSGFIATWLFIESGLGADITVGDTALSTLNIFGIVVVGVAVGSAASVAYDFKVARDASDSSAEPRLGGGSVPEQV